MADRTIPAGDTFPPLKVSVADEAGLVDLTTATSVELAARSGVNTINGTMTVIDPPETVDIDGVATQVNARYDFTAGDTDTTGSFTIRVKVTWSAGEIEHFPNAAADADHLIIEAL